MYFVFKTDQMKNTIPLKSRMALNVTFSSPSSKDVENMRQSKTMKTAKPISKTALNRRDTQREETREIFTHSAFFYNYF